MAAWKIYNDHYGNDYATILVELNGKRITGVVQDCDGEGCTWAVYEGAKGSPEYVEYFGEILAEGVTMDAEREAWNKAIQAANRVISTGKP